MSENHGTDMVTFVTSELRYDKDKKLFLKENFDGPYPSNLNVISSKSTRVVSFYQDKIAAENNEFWDGEMYEYITYDSDLRHKSRLVLLRGSV